MNQALPKIVDGLPRRCRLNLYTPAEKAIWEALQAVEAAGCDPLLTEAVILLGQAKDKVADFLERETSQDIQAELVLGAPSNNQ